MGSYTFTVTIGADALHEPIIRVLPNADQAWEAARAMIEELLRSKAQDRLLAAIMVVCDENGAIVFELPFSEVLTLPGSEPATLH